MSETENTILKPKATFRPTKSAPVATSPSENAVVDSRDYLVPMFRKYEYSRVVMRAPSAYEAKLYTENLFSPDGWEVYQDWDNYKIIDIPAGGYV